MAVGICNAVYPCDINGNVANPPLSPSEAAAVSMSYEMNTTLPSLAEDQLDLKRDVERALYGISRLFIHGDKQDPKFRPYYVQLLNLAQLGLVGPNASPDVAKRALQSTTADLIDAEGSAVKNGHLARLARVAVVLSIPCMLLYVALRLTGRARCVASILHKLSVDSVQMSSFMLLWVGCFVGVVLSYGSRTTRMTLDDLIVTDTDYLLPAARHLFAGTLTMILGILLCLGVVEVKIAGASTRQLIADPMIAFLIGTLCGISELVLPGAVAKRADSVLGLKNSSS
jgi:hypothetical protein